jgi:hypothetical protein
VKYGRATLREYLRARQEWCEHDRESGAKGQRDKGKEKGV